MPFFLLPLLLFLLLLLLLPFPLLLPLLPLFRCCLYPFIAVIALSFIAIVLGVLFSLCPRVFRLTDGSSTSGSSASRSTGSSASGPADSSSAEALLPRRQECHVFPPTCLLAPGILDGPI